VTIIEGESMVNDATGLVIYRFAVAAVVTGGFSLWQAGLQFVVVAVGSLIIGLVIAWPVAWLHRRLDDAPIEITITLLTPYAAYLLADVLQMSGVLAVLSAGLYLSRQSSRFFSANTRLQAHAVWDVLVFLLNGLLFLLIGLQLRSIVTIVAGRSLLTLIWHALLIGLAVIAVRLAWVFPAAYLPRRISARLRARDPFPGWRQVAIIAWVGMRGGLSLAAALALPLTLADGTSFPQRDLVIFFTFGIILLTLVGQGLSLGPIIRLFGLQPDGALQREHALARLEAARAALSRLNELATEASFPTDALTRLRSHYVHKLEVLTEAMGGVGDERFDAHAPLESRLRQEVLAAERAAVIGLRDRGRIDDETLRLVERELDLEEQRWN
jgi:CPA1 family monovalent cation:H+ antiporter